MSSSKLEVAVGFLGKKSRSKRIKGFPADSMPLGEHRWSGRGVVESPRRVLQWEVQVTLGEVSEEINRRLSQIFLPDNKSERPCLARLHSPEACPDNWQGELLFHETFNGDTGEGLGASHQTGWTALIANCIEKLHGK